MLYRRSNIGISAGIVGNLLAAQVIKTFLGWTKSPLAGKICVINFLNMTNSYHKILRRPDCPHCGLDKNKFLSNGTVRRQRQQQPQSIDLNDKQSHSGKLDDFNIVQFYHENSKRNFF
jgi:hypothetical protein